MSCEKRIFAIKSNGSDGALDGVAVDFDGAVAMSELKFFLFGVVTAFAIGWLLSMAFQLCDRSATTFRYNAMNKISAGFDWSIHVNRFFCALIALALVLGVEARVADSWANSQSVTGKETNTGFTKKCKQSGSRSNLTRSSPLKRQEKCADNRSMHGYMSGPEMKDAMRK